MEVLIVWVKMLITTPYHNYRTKISQIKLKPSAIQKN